jgi:branched-chain amino acid transport system ATP-binding protein
LLELRQATTGYGKFRVLESVSLAVGSGEIVCVVGANGAGKTTLMRVISGIIPLWKGSKIFNGKDVTRLSPMKLNREGMIQVPEGRLIIKDLTVEDNLRLGAYSRYFRVTKVELKQSLERVFQLFPRLENRLKQKAGTLSGGEQQMLAIGRGLMGAPKVLMLDEPSLGLAPMMVETVFSILGELHHLGLPVLLVEQNVRSALQISDRGYILETGYVVTQGASSDLLKDEKVINAYLGA